ncbi:hypothetical protein [Vibrio fortis]|uniref:hypothetical protein n=1 Tax=Vibrio fortis TaxID=212667 RepID=UPI0038CD15A6
MKAAASIVNPPQISATANVGDNRQVAELNKQKAVTFDEVDADTANINTNVKQNAITKDNSLDNANAETIIQNNSLSWYSYLLIGFFIFFLGLAIDFKTLIDNIHYAFTRKWQC